MASSRYDEGDSRNWVTQQIYALWHQIRGLTSSSKLVSGPGIIIGQDGSITAVNSNTTIGLNLDGSGAVLTTGQKGYVVVPFNATILAWNIVSREIGSAVFDVWKKAAIKPTVADTITGSAKPTLTNLDTASGSPTGWNTSIVAGDIIGWNLDSVTTLTWAILQLTVIKG